MEFFKKLSLFFSQYANTSEKNVGKFFARLNEGANRHKIHQYIINYLQEDIISFTVFTEYKYKGYNYLKSKKKRLNLYENALAVVDDFNNFEFSYDASNLANEIAGLAVKNNFSDSQIERLIYLRKIMAYFSPERGVYNYKHSSTFGELLKDPAKFMLVGDCNQIVSLYLYLYSLRYCIDDLKLISPPNHVAIYYLGIQIEATMGRFTSPDPDGDILPIQEIATINILDVTDSYFKTHKIEPKSMLDVSRLAFLVSSNREIVKKNLDTAYLNIIIDNINKNNYPLAINFAKQSKKINLIEYVAHKATIYFDKKHNFKEARKYASYSIDKKELLKQIVRSEANYLYKNTKYSGAIKLYNSLGDVAMVQNCYLALYAFEQKKLGKIISVDDIKRQSATINSMYNYAKKTGNKDLIKYSTDLKKYLKK